MSVWRSSTMPWAGRAIWERGPAGPRATVCVTCPPKPALPPPLLPHSKGGRRMRWATGLAGGEGKGARGLVLYRSGCRGG